MPFTRVLHKTNETTPLIQKHNHAGGADGRPRTSQPAPWASPRLQELLSYLLQSVLTIPQPLKTWQPTSNSGKQNLEQISINKQHNNYRKDQPFKKYIIIASTIMAVPVMSSLISSFTPSYICTCFGLCNILGRHICGDSYKQTKLLNAAGQPIR